MKFLKAKFLKQDKPTGRSYTYRTEDDVQPGDIVTDVRGSKLAVVDEIVDMGWVETYGPDKVAKVSKYINSDESGKAGGNRDGR